MNEVMQEIVSVKDSIMSIKRKKFICWYFKHIAVDILLVDSRDNWQYIFQRVF